MLIDNNNISTFEYFWITPRKSFVLTIEVPLITIKIPSNNILMKKYVEYDLIFFLYSKNFIMWDFYLINNLLTYKNFRNLLDNLYSIPEKKNLFFYITPPKHKRNLFTFYELTSLVTRERVINSNSNKRDINTMNNNTFIDNKENEKIADKLLPKKENENNEKDSDNIKINNKKTYFNSTFIQKGLLAIASFIDTENKIYNEFTFHFNLDQLRKFQVIEFFVDKLSLFKKFLRIDYESKTISFDFDSFEEFNEFNWIKDFNKYNINFLNFQSYNIELQKKFINPKMVEELPGAKKGIKIKIEIKYPLILMKALDDDGIITTEEVNVDHRVQNIIRNIIIHNSIDLTRQLVNILKDNNFCRKIYVSKRPIRKKKSKKKKILNNLNEISMKNLI